MIRQLTLIGCSLLLAATTKAGSHPQLFIREADIPRLRHACGLSDPNEQTAFGRHGWAGRDFQAVRAALAPALQAIAAGDAGEENLPGEIVAAAFLHVVAPDDTRDAQRIALVAAALRRPVTLSDDTLDRVLALDWCWSAVDPLVRREFLLQIRELNKPLRATDSPLDHRALRERLAIVTACLLFDETDEPSASWTTFRNAMLPAARAWFETTLPGFIRLRGGIPSSPASAADEECDTALAVELATLLARAEATSIDATADTPQPVWTEQFSVVGRWLDHYAFGVGGAVQAQFVRDDGDAAPPLPMRGWSDLQPITAHLIAARTGDAAAATVAARVFTASGGAASTIGVTSNPAAADALRNLWRWVPIVFDLRDRATLDERQPPVLRNLDGALLMRGWRGELPILLWIDAGQRCLRPRQHFDAGNFLIRAGGDLVVSACEDVTLDTSTARGGKQLLGREKDPFDLDQFMSASIAHNCMNFWEPTRAMHWRGKRYLPLGGQTPLDPPTVDWTQAEGARLTSTLVASGSSDAGAYALIDLGAAYDARDVQRYTREFIFDAGGLLLIVDRATTTGERVLPTWLMHLPARPTFDGRDLPADRRVQGAEDAAGIWRFDKPGWLHWKSRDGAAWLRSFAPTESRLFVAGGPAKRIALADAPGGARDYMGGDADGFERLITPATRGASKNVWYRLGRSPRVANEIVSRPLWGRVEIEPSKPATGHALVTAIVIGKATDTRAPAIDMRESDGEFTLRWQSPTGDVEFSISKAAPGGSVRSGDRVWQLPTGN